MGRVIILDEQTANQIAAGEAVERPASVVKELIENAMDACAKRIDAEIRSGGIEYIRVADDGEGFFDEDILPAFERHATSKIRVAADLDGVGTLGFRGEALPSIASVSKTRLVTRRRGAEYGRAVEIHGGRLVSNERSARQPGTTVEASELFFNTPARYKFLKRDSAEAAAVSDIAARLAVGRPDIALRLSSRGANVINTPGGGSLADAAYAVLGAETFDRLYAVEYYEGSYKVDGFFGSPECARANKNGQFFYVNGRHVRNRSIYTAVEEAYRTRMMRGKKPVVILRVTMDPKQIDANAHPAKTEVRFANDGELFRVVFHALKTAFGEGAPAAGGKRARLERSLAPGVASGWEPGAGAELGAVGGSAGAERTSVGENPVVRMGGVLTRSEPRALSGQEAEGGAVERSSPAVRTRLPQPPPQPSAQYKFMEPDASQSAQSAQSAPAPAPYAVEPEPETPRGGEGVKIIGQVFMAYIMAERGDVLYLIDQHAVHERVIYERLRESVESGGSPPCQLLLEPVAVDLMPKDAQKAEAAKDLLCAAGFLFDDFGGGSALLRGIPSYGERSDPAAFFREAVEEATFWIMSKGRESAAQRPGVMSARDEALYGIACKSALKTGRRLSAEDMSAIVRDAFSAPEPRTCPHGRPLIVEMTKRDVDRRFKRIL